MTATLQDLLHAINIIGEARDVTVDGIDSIIVCPPVKITPEGRKYFKKALAAAVIVDYDASDSHIDTYVSDDENDSNDAAWTLLCAFAGYCGVKDHEKWFEGDKAKMI